MLTFKPDKTDIRAFRSDASILFLSGPVGVGKSSLVLQKITQFVATKMLPIDGIRRARVLVAREDLPKLETSTMEVLKEWYGDEAKFHGNYPKKATVTIHNLDKTTSKIEYVMKGFPDNPKEIYSSFSGTPATILWINEVQTYSTPDIVEYGFQRMGRYLKPEQGNQGYGLVIADYNPPSNAHWIADWFKRPPDKISLDLPISGLEEHDIKIVSPFKVEFINWPSPFLPEHSEEGVLTGYRVNPEADYFYKQPSGISYWLKILQSLAKSPNKIRTNILGEFGYRSDGIPVYDGVYSERIHVADDEIQVDHDAIMYVGCDPSGFRGAAVFMQEDSRGLNVLGGVTGDEGESLSFYELLNDHIIPWLVRRNVGFDSVVVVLDPANHRNDAKMTPRDECIQAGFTAYNAPTNDTEARIEALRYFLLRSKLKISDTPDTTAIRQGMAADYYWKKTGANTLGTKPKPEKTRPFSDLIESIQYVCVYLRRGAAREDFGGRSGGEQGSQYMSTDVGFV